MKKRKNKWKKVPKHRIYRGSEYKLASGALGHAGALHDADLFRSRGRKAHIKTFDGDNWYVYVV